MGAKFGGLFEICCKTTKPKKVSTIQGHTVTKLVSNLYMLSYEARCENLALRSQPVVRLWSKWCLDLWHGAVVTLRCMEDGTHSFKMASNGNKEASMKSSRRGKSQQRPKKMTTPFLATQIKERARACVFLLTVVHPILQIPQKLGVS